MEKIFTNVLDSQCEVLTQIYQTNNYDLFGMITGNRETEDSHVKKLRQSIRTKYVNVGAIIVVKNPHYEKDLIPYLIIDGQHRYKAIVEEKLPISFVIADIPESEILNTIELLNTSKMDWDVTNFMGSKCALGEQNYIRYQMLYNRFSFEHEIFFYLMNKKMGISINHAKFKEGLLVLNETTYEEIKTVFEWLEKFIPIVGAYGKRYYLKGLLDLYYLTGINLKRLESVILKRNTSENPLLFSGSVLQSLKHLVLDLYNFNLRKNIIGLTTSDRLGNKYKLSINDSF